MRCWNLHVAGRDLRRRAALRDLIVEKDSFGGWAGHVLAWMNRPGLQVNAKFEELVTAAEPVPMVQHALKAVGFVPAASTQRHELPPSFAELQRQAPLFFRRGKIGAWRDEMPADLLDLFWRNLGEAMERMTCGKDPSAAQVVHRDAYVRIRCMRRGNMPRGKRAFG